MLDGFLLVLRELKRLHHERIPLDEFTRGKPYRDPGGLRVVLDKCHDAVQASVHRTAVRVTVAEIRAARALLVFGDVNAVTDQLVHTLIFRCGNGNDRDAQDGLHAVDADRAAVTAHLVHHVERQHDRNVEFEKLQRKVQVALDVRRVDDVDDAGRFLLQDEFAGDDLLRTVRRQRVDAGKVRDLRLRIAAHRPAHAVDRHAREIADVPVGAGQLVEQRCLAAVLVARQGKCEHCPLRERILVRLDVVFALLAEAGMRRDRHRDGLPFLRKVGRLVAQRLRHGRHFDVRGVRQPQRQLVSVDRNLHRVAHRRELFQRDNGAGDQPHVQHMLSQGTLAADCFDFRSLSDFQVLQSHIVNLSRHAVRRFLRFFLYR